MDINLKVIKKILSKHKYKISIVLINDTITIFFPNIIHQFFQRDSRDITYRVLEDGLAVDGTPVKLPKYAIHGYFFTDMIRRCQLIEYNPLLLEFFIEDRKVNEYEFMDSLPLNLDEDEIILQENLKGLIIQYFTGQQDKLDEAAKQLNVEEGFQKVFSLLQS